MTSLHAIYEMLAKEAADEVTNTDPRGMALSQFTADREAIVAWLTKVEQQTQQKPDITGHSLGGALAPDKDNFLVGDRQNNTADGAEGNDTIIGKESL